MHPRPAQPQVVVSESATVTVSFHNRVLPLAFKHTCAVVRYHPGRSSATCEQRRNWGGGVQDKGTDRLGATADIQRKGSLAAEEKIIKEKRKGQG